MSDKTFGVKVNEELHDKVKDMIEVSGLTAKEWFEKAVALVELQQIKEEVSDYKEDLTELEVHTTRIYELISNMVARSIYLRDAAVKEIADNKRINGNTQAKKKKGFFAKNKEAGTKLAKNSK